MADMKNKNTTAYLAIRQERFEKLCADYRRIISEAVAEHGNARALAAALNKSPNYIYECKKHGIVALKKCAEEIGALEEHDRWERLNT